jgi:hypothetical protein
METCALTQNEQQAPVSSASILEEISSLEEILTSWRKL